MELNNNKDLIVENEILPDLGIIMSYGVSNDMVPMGIFFVEGYYNMQGEKLDKLPLDKKEVEVEFSQYELTEDFKVKKVENGLTVRMPYNKAKELYTHSAEFNYEEADKLSNKMYEGRTLIASLDKGVSDVLSQNPQYAKVGMPGFKAKYLDSLEGSFYASDGSDMGVDFCVFPFLYSKIKTNYLEKIMNKKDKYDKEQLLYNYIYSLEYKNQISKTNEEQEEEPRIRLR